MRKFRVLIEGRNFLINTPKGQAKHGFYATRFVEATDEAGAEAAAVEQLRNRPGLRDAVLNGRDDPPMVHVREIEQIASFDGIESLDPGLAWYKQDESGDDASMHQ